MSCLNPKGVHCTLKLTCGHPERPVKILSKGGDWGGDQGENELEEDNSKEHGNWNSHNPKQVATEEETTISSPGY